MDIFKQGMKGPTRPAPAVPGLGGSRYSPVTNWDTDPFGDVFEPQPHFQKKKPPPRPPPPKVTKQPDIPSKPSHFIRRPTVLSSLLTRKTKITVNQHVNHHNLTMDLSSEVETHKMFPKCEPKIIQTGALIDLSSPPSSPTFTTRSSSDGLSVDSFGSDATTSTNHPHANNGGNASQAESGFEDDFDLFLNTRKQVSKEDSFDELVAIDPFSLQPANKPLILKKPVEVKTNDFFEITNNRSQPTAPSLKRPTIIRAKPVRPKPPDNSALLKTTFGNSFPVATMNVNTTTPITKVNNGFGDSFDSKPLQWEDSSPEREDSPPMPKVPPPPPPAVIDDDLPVVWPEEDELDVADLPLELADQGEPYATALFDYNTDHPDDLCFAANARITLLKQIDNEWMFGRLRSGAEGMFPSNYVQVQVPLSAPAAAGLGALSGDEATATALYDFDPAQPGDLRLRAGESLTLLYKLNDEWYFGEADGATGQFPANYVHIS